MRKALGVLLGTVGAVIVVGAIAIVMISMTGPAIVTVQDWPLPNDGVVHLTWAPCCVQVPIVLVTV